MIRKKFSTTINAPREKVWQALWDLESYKQWTSVFCEGSYAKTDDWKEGSRVHFLTPAGEGMYSDVERNIPNEYITFQHLGEIKDFKELPKDEKTAEWMDAKEIYILKDIDGGTVLNVELDTTEEYQDFFNNVFPKALEKVKELAENNKS